MMETIRLTDILMITAVLTGPLMGVGWTLFQETQNRKKRAKENLFMTLLATRKSFPIPPKFVDALNTIDVVFHGCDSVIKSWKELYRVYHTPPFDVDNHNRKLLDLLDAMAKELGYKNVKQTDYDEFYAPQLYANQAAFQAELNTEILRVLKNSENYGSTRRTNQDNQTLE